MATSESRKRQRSRPSVLTLPGMTGVAVLFIGAILAAGGLYLAALGGTWYDAIAGIGLIVTGWLLLRRRRAGLWAYALVFAFTLVWTLIEVGTDGWKQVPRLVAPAVLGMWIALPWIAGRLGSAETRRDRVVRWSAFGTYAAVFVGVFASGWLVTAARWERHGAPRAAAAFASIDAGVPAGEWHQYGRTSDGTRYSPLAQITPANVERLEQVWRFDTGDMPRPGESKGGREFNFEATPIKVGDTLYFCTPHRQVIALDAVTGKQRWRFDPQNDTSANIYLACRGVAYYAAGSGDPCPERIISTTADARLFALDARTGRLCSGFGRGGYVSLRQNMGAVPRGFHFSTSQPLVMRGRIMLSGWVYDNQTVGEPSGVIRAFDARTGKLSWAWDLGRADPTAPLGPGESYTRGTPNGWGSYTADERLGLVYVPLGNATPDYWGGKRRPFDEEYASSLVALDIETGRERWHYQTVHHDVWDYDVPVGPSLVDLPDGRGGTVPALVQNTKVGFLFLLDRRTGRPLAEVRERPVPQDGLPGDRLSPTQPVPVGMPLLTPPDLKPADIWGATPIDQLLCRIQFARSRYEGIYTPTSQQGSILYPAFDGVVDWHGLTIDPARKLLIANTSYIPFTSKARTTEQAIKEGLIHAWKGWGHVYRQPPNFADAPQYGTPFAVSVKPWLNPLGVPCMAPPWGKMVAIDLVTRKVVWERPVGTTRDMGLFNTHLNAPLPTGIFNIGGNMVTGGGLIFVGAYADNYLRAIDERTGEILWRGRLPAGGQATPMTYQGRDGRQYVVIAAGGHGGLRTRAGDSVIAYALPPAS